MPARLGSALLAVSVGLCALPGAAGARAADAQVVRVLVAKLTWGPQPFAAAEVDAVDDATAAFYADASFGTVSLRFTQTPWLDVMGGEQQCASAHPITFPASLAPLAEQAGYDPAAYDRVIFLLPQACGAEGIQGIYEPAGIYVGGEPTVGLVAHELGHSFGMGHAGLIDCHFRGTRRFCHTSVYGDPWDVMGGDYDATGSAGSPVFDPGALQKARAGWLTSITRIGGPGTYRLGPREVPGSEPQALVIQAAGFQYWVDHREALGNDAGLTQDGYNPTPGFEVHRFQGDPLTGPRNYPNAADYLVPWAHARVWVTPPGSTLTVPGVFALTDLGRSDGVLTVRFRWADTAKPTEPRLVGVSGSNTSGSPLTVVFEPSSDRGSGVSRYLVTLDGAQTIAQPAQVQQSARVTVALPALASGRHTLALVAVDRAGNRTAPERSSFTAP